MKTDPSRLQRFTAQERANHWIVGISFILLALSGLALFHPMFYPLTQLFGGGTWTRILHPYLGVFMAIFFLLMFFRFVGRNLPDKNDGKWLAKMGTLVCGDESKMPEQGKFNAGQKLVFWLSVICMVLLLLSGLVIWQAQITMPADMKRQAVVLHAIAAFVMMAVIIIHIYAALWVKGSIRAMWQGWVTRAWARQHHRAWYRELTGK